VAQKISIKKSWAFQLPDNQAGNKNSWKFRSITTPGHSFSLFQFLSEMVVLQRFGIKVPQYFWYKKTNCPKMRDTFYSVQNQIAGMIRKNRSITALQLLSIVCEKFPPLPMQQVVGAAQEPVESPESANLVVELDDSPKQETLLSMAKKVHINE
jgi:hypothetical protein